jgi:serine protease Do
MKGDPAEKAGIEAGDVVLKIGDKRVRTPNDLLFAVLNYKPGDKIPVLVDRRGKEKEFLVVARQRDGKEGRGSSIRGQNDLLNELGLALTETDEGVAISGIVGGSRADAANLRRGDTILEVNRNPVKRIKDVIDALGKTQNNIAVFYVDRNGAKFFVPLTLGNAEDK